MNRQGSFIEFTKVLIDKFYVPSLLPPVYKIGEITGLYFYRNIVVLEKRRNIADKFALRIGDTSTIHFIDAL